MHVSTDINVSYYSGMRPGERITIRAVCPRVGGRLAFSEVSFLTVGLDGKEITAASGRHTKYIIREMPIRSKL